MTCTHCGATVTNGLALCDLCQRKAAADLEFLPVYFRNLARWRRPARPNGSLGTRGQWLIRSGESESDRVSRALDEAGADVATWVRCLVDDRGVREPQADDEAGQVAACCRLLAEHLTSIATLPWAGDFVTATSKHEAHLRSLTEVVVPGWYAGECQRCTSPTYVVPGLTWVTCRACGVTTYARDHLETILDEARGWVARPVRIAEAVVALVDTEISIPRLHDRIRQWSARGHIEAIRRLDADGDEVGPKRYRLGEVLDLIFTEGETRTTDMDTQAS